MSPFNLAPLSNSTQRAVSEEGNPACLGRFLRFMVSASGLTPHESILVANEHTVE